MNASLKITGASLLFLFIIACNGNKKVKKTTIIPVISLIKDQVADIDTSLYSILKITRIDSASNDTVYLKREEFKEAAKDFLSLPDISLPAFNERYIEDSSRYDFGRAIFTYLPVDPEKEEIQREELLVKPDPPNDKVTTIIIHTVLANKDSSVEKRLLWNMDESFQVTTIKQLPGRPEAISTFNVVWNEREY